MNAYRTLSSLLVLSAAFLVVGGLVLRLENLVPVSLTLSTAVTVAFILLVSHFVWRRSFPWIVVGAVLGVASIVFNSLQTAHLDAILHPFSSIYMTVLVFSEIMGFYLLPAAYLAVFGMKFSSLRAGSS